MCLEDSVKVELVVLSTIYDRTDVSVFYIFLQWNKKLTIYIVCYK